MPLASDMTYFLNSKPDPPLTIAAPRLHTGNTLPDLIKMHLTKLMQTKTSSTQPYKQVNYQYINRSKISKNKSHRTGIDVSDVAL
jgi:hypothetical protein